MQTVPVPILCSSCAAYTVEGKGMKCDSCVIKLANNALIENDQMRRRITIVGMIIGFLCLIVFVAAIVKGI